MYVQYIMAAAIDEELQDITYEDLVIFSNYMQTYINQVFGDQTVRKAVQKILKPSIWEITGARRANDNDFSGDDDSMHHILIKKANPSVIWCSVESQEYQNTHINKNDTLCQSYTLLKLSGELDKYKPIPESEENHIAIQKEMINLYRKIINNKSFVQAIDDTFYSITEPPHDWFHIDGTEIKPTLKNWKKMATDFIKEIKKTLDDWENYGHLYLVGDPRKKYFTIPLENAIQEKNLPKIKEFIDMGERIRVVEPDDDDNDDDKLEKDDIRKLLVEGAALLEKKKNMPPRKKQRLRKGGKSKTKRKKSKDKKRTKKRYK